MAYVQRVKQPWWHRNRSDVVADEPVAADDTAVVAPNYGINIISRIIWFVAGVILLLLAFRFVLALLALIRPMPLPSSYKTPRIRS